MLHYSVDFRITGVVQGVIFRKHTAAEATRLGLVGWVANASDGSVIGSFQGREGAVADMRRWLRHVGSPKSRIMDATFVNERVIPALEFSAFAIRSMAP
ncbi:hypothetical protein ACHAXA_003158 [Cyclostephanos tholiformis]|uniref:Acylphosphatase n=1 Tax=Cyclostephanos tholiformis TaxID=382380 RepID=A0ABD3SS42_9STRA